MVKQKEICSQIEPAPSQAGPKNSNFQTARHRHLTTFCNQVYRPGLIPWNELGRWDVNVAETYNRDSSPPGNRDEYAVREEALAELGQTGCNEGKGNL